MPLSIAEQLVVLAELATADQQQKVANDRLEALPAEARKADTLALKLKGDLDSVALRKTSSEAARKSAEHEAADERTKIRKWEARANDIRGEREHTALSSEIGGAKRQIRQLEDGMLEQMEAIEAADKELTGINKKHATATAAAKNEWQSVEADVARLREEIAGYAAVKKGLLEQLPAPIVKRYELVAAKRQGVGVAIITTRDSCGACNRAVPAQLSLQVQKGLIVESCPACLRLLVHHTQAAAAVVAGVEA